MRRETTTSFVFRLLLFFLLLLVLRILVADQHEQPVAAAFAITAFRLELRRRLVLAGLGETQRQLVAFELVDAFLGGARLSVVSMALGFFVGSSTNVPLSGASAPFTW